MSIKILILGGTRDARLLSEHLSEDERWEPILSLAGRTKDPILPSIKVRTGGFGGSEGLKDYLEGQDIKAVVDATHPFAERMSMHAFTAAKASNIAFVHLQRSSWVAEASDDWRFARDMKTAVDLIPPESRVFLGIGRQQLPLFARRTDCWFLMRSIEPVDGSEKLPNGHYIESWPKSGVEEEMALLHQHRITHLVSKNSGGDRAYQKILAARALAVPVVMVERPALPGPLVLGDQGAVIQWLHEKVH